MTSKRVAATTGKAASSKRAAVNASPVAKSVAEAPRRVAKSVTSAFNGDAARSGQRAKADSSARLIKAAKVTGSAAMNVVADLTDLVSEASHNTLAVNPLLGLSRSNLADSAKSLLKAVVVTPRKAGTHLGRYARELGQVASGKSQLAPDPKDRRFADPAWRTNAICERLMQGYLVTRSNLAQFIDESNLSTIEKGRAHFFASLVTDALSPSNWPIGNPTAMRKVIDTGGENFVKGVKNLIHDVRFNNMMPSMVDAKPFVVGETVATSPGHVVYRHEMFELLQFTPTTPEVHQRPLIISPPQVNKYYAMDLTPDKSLVKWATDSGIQLFVVSWRNPTLEHRHWGLDDYVMALDTAVDVTRQICDSPDVNMWGSCSGGMTLAAYLGWLAAKGDRKVVNTTWAVCVLNSQVAVEDSTLGLFSSPTAIRTAKARSRRKGMVSGDEMASMFAWLRPNDLIWNYWVNNYLLGNNPPAYDVLAWNADTTRLPGQYHCDLLDMVEKNPFVNPGALEIHGVPIDMGKVDLGAYVVAGITDHITPWRGCYGTARLFGPDTMFILANAGHLQSMINPPGAPKSFYFSGPAAFESAGQWAEAAQASRAEGSWWPHWRLWIQAHSGDKKAAPKKAGSRKYKPLCAAPGTYVHDK